MMSHRPHDYGEDPPSALRDAVTLAIFAALATPEMRAARDAAVAVAVRYQTGDILTAKHVLVTVAAAYLRAPVVEMDAPIRFINAVQFHREWWVHGHPPPVTVRDLVLIPDDALRRVRNMGGRTVNRVIEVLAEMGLRLGMTEAEVRQIEAAAGVPAKLEAP